MLENLITYLSSFIAVFSTIAIIRLIVNFVSALLSNPPKKMEFSDRVLTIYGLFLSYIITFLIFVL